MTFVHEFVGNRLSEPTVQLHTHLYVCLPVASLAINLTCSCGRGGARNAKDKFTNGSVVVAQDCRGSFNSVKGALKALSPSEQVAVYGNLDSPKLQKEQIADFQVWGVITKYGANSLAKSLGCFAKR